MKASQSNTHLRNNKNGLQAVNKSFQRTNSVSSLMEYNRVKKQQQVKNPFEPSKRMNSSQLKQAMSHSNLQQTSPSAIEITETNQTDMRNISVEDILKLYKNGVPAKPQQQKKKPAKKAYQPQSPHDSVRPEFLHP